MLETQFPAIAETQPALLAHHYTEAGLAELAVEYLQRAGQQAMQRWAYAEAIRHLTTAVEILKTLPDTVERAERELVLQLPLGRALRVTKGAAALETGRAYTRTRELCQQVGEGPQLMMMLDEHFEFYLNQAKHQTAHELAERFLSLRLALPRSGGLSVRAMKERRTILVPNVAAEPGANQRLNHIFDTQSLMVVPLIARDQALDARGRIGGRRHRHLQDRLEQHRLALGHRLAHGDARRHLEGHLGAVD